MFITNNLLVSAFPQLSLSSQRRQPYDESHLWGAGGGREGTALWWMPGHWVRKATDHTSEILIRRLSRREVHPACCSRQHYELNCRKKNKNDSHHQKSPPSVETDTAITWEASLQSAHLALTVKAVDVLCVSMRAIMHVCLHTGDCATASWIRP